MGGLTAEEADLHDLQPLQYTLLVLYYKQTADVQAEFYYC